MRLVSALAAVVVVLALSGVAQAQPNGSISGATTDASWARGRAQFKVTYADCGLDGGRGCSWSAAAYLIPPDEFCRRFDPFAIPAPRWLAWASGGQGVNASVSEEVEFTMFGVSGQRLCLFVFDRVTKSYWIGTSDFVVGTLPPPPAPAAPTPRSTPSALTAASAKVAALKGLQAKYAKTWRASKGRKVTCAAPKKGKSACRVRFRVGKVRYTGTVVVSGDNAKPKTTFRITKRRA